MSHTMEIRIISSVRIVAGMVATIAIRESLIHAKNAASCWSFGIRIIVAVSLLAPIAAEPTLMIPLIRGLSVKKRIGLMLKSQSESWAKTQATLSKRQAEVYNDISISNQPLSAFDLSGLISRVVYTVRPRLTELKQLSIIEPCGFKYHAPTDRNEAVWRVKSDDGQGVLF